MLHDRRGNETPWYGIGQSLVMLPFDAAATLAGARTPAARFRFLQLTLFPLVNGAAVAAAGLLLTALGFGALSAAAGALALAFGTSALWHFQNNQENPLALLLVLAALTGALRWVRDGRRTWLALMGACLGLDLLMRLPNAVDAIVVTALPLVLVRDRGRYARDWMSAALPPLALAALGERLYHFARFGRWTGDYMHLSGDLARQLALPVPAGFPFSNPFWQGLAGPFVSLERSVFIYDPLLLLALIVAILWWRRMARPVRALVLLAAAGIVLEAALYATFYNWGGASGWGDRYLTTWVWIALLPAVPLLVELGARRSWIAAALALAVAVQIASVMLPSWVEESRPAPAEVIVSGSVGNAPPRFGHFILGERLANLAALARGATDVHPPILVPLMPLNSVPDRLRLWLKLAWFATLAAMLMLVVTTLGAARRGAWAAPPGRSAP